MKSIVLLSAVIFFFNPISAQDTTTRQPFTGKPYTIQVVKMDGSVLKGFLYDATPSGISVIKSTKDSLAAHSISTEQINKFFLRKKGNVGLGLIIGAIGGTAIGAVIGAASPDDSEEWFGLSTQEKTVMGGTIGFFSGAGLGLMIGALTKKKFIIQGKKENYQLKYPAIVERAMIQHQ